MVLNNAPVHVDHIERAVRAHLDIDRPKALVRRREELDLLPLRIGIEYVFGRDLQTLITQRKLRYRVGGRLGDEHLPHELGAKLIAAEHRHAAGAGGPVQAAVRTQHAGHVGAVYARVDASGVHLIVGADALPQPGRPAVAGGNNLLRVVSIAQQQIRIGVVEQTAFAVLGNAPLAPEQRWLFDQDTVLQLQPAAGFGAVEPVVDAREQAVFRMLHRAGLIAVDTQPFASAAVDIPGQPAVARAQPKVGRLADEQTVVDDRQCPGQHQLVRQHFARVKAAITVAVPQAYHRAHGVLFSRTVGVRHKAAHLCHVQVAVFVPGHGHGIFHQGFGGDQFDFEARRHGKAAQRFGRRKLRRRRRVDGQVEGFAFGIRRGKGARRSEAPDGKGNPEGSQCRHHGQ